MSEKKQVSEGLHRIAQEHGLADKFGWEPKVPKSKYDKVFEAASLPREILGKLPSQPWLDRADMKFLGSDGAISVYAWKGTTIRVEVISGTNEIVDIYETAFKL